MSDINFQEFLAGLDPEQQKAMAAAMYQYAPDAATSALSDSAAAQALVKTVVKPARVSKRGPSFWDNLWADADVLSAVAGHLNIEESDASSVMNALVSRLTGASQTGTIDRTDENGVVHKCRIVFMDETAKTTSAIQKKIDGIIAADSESALTTAVAAALKSLKGARALPDGNAADLKEAIESAQASKQEALNVASEPAPPAPPA